MIDASVTDPVMWNLFGPEFQVLDSLTGASFHIERNSRRSVTLSWTLADGTSVQGRVRIDGEKPLSFWSIDVSAFPGEGLTSVQFPIIRGLKAAENEKLAVSSWQGTLLDNPREGASQQEKTYRWSCPGSLTMQLVALYGDNMPGLYFSTTDSLNLSKTYGLDLTAEHSTFHICEEMSEEMRDSYHSSYERVLGLFHGDWHEAASIYRSCVEDMPWFKDSRVGSGKTASWAVETPVWVWNRGCSDNVFPEAEDFSNYLGGLPVSVLWHWWHGCAYDNGFPEYVPPREGEDAFIRAVADVKAKGINAIVYMNAMQWGAAADSYKTRNADNYKAVTRDGGDYSAVANVFMGNPIVPMCMGTDFWKDTYHALCDTVLNDYGVSGVYMDQACNSLKCYNPEHGHPVGGGNSWVMNFGILTGMIRGSSENPVLAGEGSGESWMPYLDLFLTLEASRERYLGITGVQTIPLFQAVYHDRAICFGSYSSLVYPPYDDKWPDEFRPANRETELPEDFNSQFRMEQAKGFVWGTQPMIANYHSFLRNSRPLELEYLKRIVLTRRNAPEYLGCGICAGAPSVPSPQMTIDVSRISIYAGRFGNAVTKSTIEVPQIYSEGWLSADGNYAVALTNISDDTLPVRFAVNPSDYGIKGPYSVNIIDCDGRRELLPKRRGVLDIDLTINARDAYLIEFVK